MSKYIHINQAQDNIGELVTLKGFVHILRDQGSIKFIQLRDNTGIIQLVILKNNDQAFTATEKLHQESVIEVKGLLKEATQAPGGIEVEAKEIDILSNADPELPIPVVAEKGADKTDITKRLNWRWIDLRKPNNLNIFRAWTALENGFRRYLLNDGFIQIYTPSFMNTASESGAEVFEVKYFDKKAYLAQSPQFYKQMAMASGFERVFMVGPVYRAEPSFTTRHMTEFTGWDFELSYINSHHDIMDVEESALREGFKELKKHGFDIEEPSTPFPRVSLKEVKEMLSKEGITSDKSDDISPEEEKAISRIIKQETGSDFVFITDYPVSARPFYHMRHEDDPSLTKSFDLIYRGVEVTTGAQREHRYDILLEQAKQKNMPLESLENYLNFFKYGCPPHGGVGIGPARIIMKVLDLSSVKEATLLPRDVNRLTP